MSRTEHDALERAIERALGPDDTDVHAPAGFVGRVESRVYFAGLLERRRRMLRNAAVLGAGSAMLFLAVLALYVQTVDLPGWVVENVPGVLGRFDAIRVAAERSPSLVVAALGGLILTAAGIVSAAFRPRRD